MNQNGNEDGRICRMAGTPEFAGQRLRDHTITSYIMNHLPLDWCAGAFELIDALEMCR